MTFRNDINGLRAIAVLSVVIFHFFESALPGGFVGVDVFFVISGFLMTAIICNKLEKDAFNLWEFYYSRANRIIPALVTLCSVLIILGWLFLSPYEYSELGKQVASSVTFTSNILYYTQSGYFSSNSMENWLLHTWSLSVEWQFYILYPLAIFIIHRFVGLKALRSLVPVMALISLSLSIWLTPKNPSLAYFVLPTRAWEMLAGGVVFLFPMKMNSRLKLVVTLLGIFAIALSCFIFSENTLWPGYAALLPAVGAALIICANHQKNLVLNKSAMQLIGSWSYSIYLWHWPFVVAIYTYKLGIEYSVLCFALSILMGFLSFKFIESVSFTNKGISLKERLTNKSVLSSITVALLGLTIFVSTGFIQLAPAQYQTLISDVQPSPLRNRCHIESHQPPENACTYFHEENAKWATFGDSHSVELAFALGTELKQLNEGIMHFSFSDCAPAYGMPHSFSKCAKWYNESIDYISTNAEIENVVFVHRYSSQIVGGSNKAYPNQPNSNRTERTHLLLHNIDRAIAKLAATKQNVFIIYPIPELPQNITRLIDKELEANNNFEHIAGTEYDWYTKRNEVIIKHFENASYPSNVVFIEPAKQFCGNDYCFSVKNGRSLYFDDDHPSLFGASQIVKSILNSIQEIK